MAFNFSPRIVQQGLVLCLDAANPKSYVSGSTVWNDLTPNGNSGTLTNGPTFSSSNGGSIVFDGVDDYGRIYSLDLSNTDQITIDIWMKFTTNELKIILEHSANFNNFNAFLIDISEYGGFGSFQFSDHAPNGYNISYTTSGFNDNKWHSFIVTSDRSKSATEQTKIYADGVLNTILSPNYRVDTTSNYSNYDLYIASRAGSSFFYNSNISNIKIYNRALSPTEVLQNYNATKGRFGLT